MPRSTRRQADRRTGVLPQPQRIHAGDARPHPVHGRGAVADRVGGGIADPVPRARRREPRADGLEHAAPGGALPARREAAGRHRHRAHRCGGLGHGGAGPSRRRGRLRRREPHRGARERRGNRRRSRRGHLQPGQVHAFQPEHQHQPAPAGEGGRPDRPRRRGRRRRFDRHGRAGARAEPAGRVHALERLQLRGLDPDLGARGGRRPLHLDPHRGTVGGRARHQARAGRDHARHLEPVRGATGPTGRIGHHLHRRRSRSRRRAGRQGHAQGRDPADAGREAAARDLRREGLRREGHQPARALGHVRHGDRRAGVHPRRHRARQACGPDHRRRAEALQERPGRPVADRRRRRLRADRAPAAEQDRQRRSEEAREGHQDHQGVPGGGRAPSLVRHPPRHRRGAGAARAAEGQPRAEARGVRRGLRGKEEEAHQRRRAAARACRRWSRCTSR